MSDSVSIEFVRQVVLQLLAGEWVDTNDVCSALDLDFKTCMHMFDFSRKVLWNKPPLNGQFIITKFRIRPGGMGVKA